MSGDPVIGRTGDGVGDESFTADDVSPTLDVWTTTASSSLFTSGSTASTFVAFDEVVPVTMDAAAANAADVINEEGGEENAEGNAVGRTAGESSRFDAFDVCCC